MAKIIIKEKYTRNSNYCALNTYRRVYTDIESLDMSEEIEALFQIMISF
jgi:hypothetical protein